MNIEIKNSSVFRDGAPIGTITGGVCSLSVKSSPPLKGAINKAHGKPLKFEAAAEAGAPMAPVMPSAVAATVNLPKPAPEGDIGNAPKTPYQVELERLHDLVRSNKIPAPPPYHPSLGDKTPAFVAWFKEHATPQSFEAKFGGKRLPTIEDHEREERRLRDRKLRDEVEDSGN